MKLYFLDPSSRAAIHVARLRRSNFNVGRIIAESVESLDALIIMGNGTPDDKILGALSYHLDGGKTVGLVKPGKITHLSVLDLLKTYLRPRMRKLMILIDQEDLTLNELFDEALRRMCDIGINASEVEVMDRLRVYQCSLVGREFSVIIVVSGLEEISSQTHSIEDHLAKAAEIQVVENSKQSWRSLNRSEREEVFRRLEEKRIDEIEEIFPQQVSGCRRLAEGQ